MRRIFTISLYLLIFTSGSAFAEDAAASKTEKKVEATEQSAVLQALIERLALMEARVAELEARETRRESAVRAAESPLVPSRTGPGEAVAAAAAQPAASPAPGQDQHDQHGSAIFGALEQEYPNLKIRGFADVIFSATNIPGPNGGSSGFNTGQFILHFASPLSKKVSYFGEVSMSFFPTGTFFLLERSVIRYDYNDAFKVSFGQSHLPSSYYNETFHHGQWLQSTIFRPAMTDFVTGPLPQHILGATVEGTLPGKAMRVGYVAGIGNGRNGFGAGDVDSSRAWYASVYTRPQKLDGLRIGAVVYQDKIRRLGVDYRQLITGAHFVWQKETPEIIAEFSNIHNTAIISRQEWNSQMFYVQLGYRLPFDNRKWKPYYLFDYINTPATEPLFGVRDLVSSSLGLRYDISDFAAFKAEYRNQKRRITDPRFQGLFLQTSFTF